MLRIFKKYNKLFSKDQKIKVFILLIMMIFGAIIEALGVGLMLPLVSAVMEPNVIETNKYFHAICVSLGISTQKSFIVLCFITLIFVFIFKNIYLIIEYYFQYKFIHNSKMATQRKLLNIYMNMPYEYFLNVESGEILRVLGADIGNSYNLLILILSIGTEVIISAVLLVTIFIVNPFMTGVTVLTLGLTMLVIIKIFRPILKREGLKRQKAIKLNNKWLLQAINGIKEIKITQTEAYFQKKVNSCEQTMLTAERRNSIYGSIPRMLTEMVCVTTILSVVLVMVLNGTDVADLIPALSAFAMAAIKIMPSANKITAGISQVTFLEPALDNLLNDLDLMNKTEVKGTINTCQKNEIKQMSKMTHDIALSEVEYRYPNSQLPILENANMCIPIGSSVGIVGASGAGKTTAVDIILGLLKPQKGQVLCDGTNVLSDYSGWLKRIGYIPQMIFMLDDTIRANVAFGCEENEINDEDVWKAIDEAQLGDFVRSLPEGLDTEIGERGVRISGGQRQRIGIARALYSDPEILVFDEATSALDNETEAAIMESINALHGQKTMIIIAHRLTTIEECDLIYRVENRKIISEKKI